MQHGTWNMVRSQYFCWWINEWVNGKREKRRVYSLVYKNFIVLKGAKVFLKTYIYFHGSWRNHSPKQSCNFMEQSSSLAMLGDLRGHQSFRLFVDLEHLIKSMLLWKLEIKKCPLWYSKGDLFLIDWTCLNAFLSLCRSIKTMTHLVVT